MDNAPPARPTPLVNVALSLAVGLLVLLLAEGGSRLFEAPAREAPEVAEYLWDWQEKWDGEFYTMRSAAVGWPPWEEFNRDGLRDRTHATEKAAGVRRVVFLGDSVTLGDGIEPQQAYPQVLQEILDQRGPGVEVFNVALWGWSTRQQRIAFERIALSYAPDVVILGVCLNDIPELQNNLARPPAWLAWLFERSALVRRIVDAPGRELKSVEELFVSPESSRVREAYGRFEAELRELSEEVRASGATLSLLVFPFRFQLEPDGPEPVAQRRLVEMAAALELSVLDVLGALQPLGPTAFHDYDHLSPEGARRVAEFLADAEALPRPLDTASLLAQVQPEAALADASAPPENRRAAAWVLGHDARVGAAGMTGLAAVLGDEDASVRREAAAALGRRLEVPEAQQAAPSPLSPEAQAAVEGLLVALADEHESVRHEAARALWAVVPRVDWVEGLALALASPDAYVRGFAAWSLGTLGEHAVAAIPALVAALDQPEGFDRGGAATALGRIGPAAAEALPALATGLASTDAERRWKAARALGRVAEGAPVASQVVDPLRHALSDPDERVRSQAARALGRLGGVAGPAADDLAKATGDPVAEVRKAAAEALRLISG